MFKNATGHNQPCQVNTGKEYTCCREGLQIPRPDWSAEAKLHFVERVCILRRLKYKLIVRYPNFYELTLRSATKTASNVADSDKIAGPATKSAPNVAD